MISSFATLSLCMIVKNEEKRLGACLESVRDVVDEIVIADTGSKDRTIEIAKGYTQHVFSIEWESDFAKARNQSIARATGDWILVLDADEVVDHWPAKEVHSILTTTLADSFVIPIVNHMDKGERILHGAVMRLFRRDPDLQFRGIIHEDMGPSLQEKGCIIEAWPYSINHYGYLDEVIEEKNKRSRNMSLLNEQLKSRTDDPFVWFNFGNEYMAARDMDQAEECYRKVLFFAPKGAFYLPYAMRCLLDIYVDRGQMKEALPLVKEAIALFPDYTDLYYLLGIIFINTGHPEKAINWFQRCMQMGEAPIQYSKIDGVSSYLSLYGQAFAYRKQGMLREVVMYCVQSLKQNQLYIPALSMLIETLLTQESPEAVSEFISRCTDVNHESVSTVLKQYQLL